MYFVFACIWAYGSALYYDGTVDHRLIILHSLVCSNYPELKLSRAIRHKSSLGLANIYDWWKMGLRTNHQLLEGKRKKTNF
jgi:hypothetical protein